MNFYTLRYVTILITFFSLTKSFSAQYQEQYKAIIFGDPSSTGYLEGVAYAINESNQVTGYFSQNGRVYLFLGDEEGNYEIIHESNSLVPYAINDRGDIVGGGCDIKKPFNFLWLAEEHSFYRYNWKEYLPESSSFYDINNERFIASNLNSGNGFQGKGVVFQKSSENSEHMYRRLVTSNKRHLFNKSFNGYSIYALNNRGYCILNCLAWPGINKPGYSKHSETYIMDIIDQSMVYVGKGTSIKLKDNMDVLFHSKENKYYIWNNGTLIEIKNMTPRSLNNHREVVGRNSQHEVLLWKNGVTIKLIDLIDIEKYNIIEIEGASGINDQGSISCWGKVTINNTTKRVPILLIRKQQ